MKISEFIDGKIKEAGFRQLKRMVTAVNKMDKNKIPKSVADFADIVTANKYTKDNIDNAWHGIGTDLTSSDINLKSSFEDKVNLFDLDSDINQIKSKALRDRNANKLPEINMKKQKLDKLKELKQQVPELKESALIVKEIGDKAAKGFNVSPIERSNANAHMLNASSIINTVKNNQFILDGYTGNGKDLIDSIVKEKTVFRNPLFDFSNNFESIINKANENVNGIKVPIILDAKPSYKGGLQKADNIALSGRHGAEKYKVYSTSNGLDVNKNENKNMFYNYLKKEELPTKKQNLVEKGVVPTKQDSNLTLFNSDNLYSGRIGNYGSFSPSDSSLNASKFVTAYPSNADMYATGAATPKQSGRLNMVFNTPYIDVKNNPIKDFGINKEVAKKYQDLKSKGMLNDNEKKEFESVSNIMNKSFGQVSPLTRTTGLNPLDDIKRTPTTPGGAVIKDVDGFADYIVKEKHLDPKIESDNNISQLHPSNAFLKKPEAEAVIRQKHLKDVATFKGLPSYSSGLRNRIVEDASYSTPYGEGNTPIVNYMPGKDIPNEAYQLVRSSMNDIDNLSDKEIQLKKQNKLKQKELDNRPVSNEKIKRYTESRNTLKGQALFDVDGNMLDRNGNPLSNNKIKRYKEHENTIRGASDFDRYGNKFSYNESNKRLNRYYNSDSNLDTLL